MSLEIPLSSMARSLEVDFTETHFLCFWLASPGSSLLLYPRPNPEMQIYTHPASTSLPTWTGRR